MNFSQAIERARKRERRITAQAYTSFYCRIKILKYWLYVCCAHGHVMSAPCIIYHKTGLIIWQILAAMHIWMVSHWTAAFGSVWHEHRTEPQCIHCGNNYMWARACESNRQTHISIECKCHKPIDRMFRIRSDRCFCILADSNSTPQKHVCRLLDVF